MPQPIPTEDINREQTLPFCQKCLEKVATKVCHRCGCPLCWECYREHGCLKNTGHLKNKSVN